VDGLPASRALRLAEGLGRPGVPKRSPPSESDGAGGVAWPPRAPPPLGLLFAAAGAKEKLCIGWWAAARRDRDGLHMEQYPPYPLPTCSPITQCCPPARERARSTFSTSIGRACRGRVRLERITNDPLAPNPGLKSPLCPLAAINNCAFLFLAGSANHKNVFWSLASGCLRRRFNPYGCFFGIPGLGKRSPRNPLNRGLWCFDGPDSHSPAFPPPRWRTDPAAVGRPALVCPENLFPPKQARATSHRAALAGLFKLDIAWKSEPTPELPRTSLAFYPAA